MICFLGGVCFLFSFSSIFIFFPPPDGERVSTNEILARGVALLGVEETRWRWTIWTEGKERGKWFGDPAGEF